jgi:hypothetical protein
MAMLGMGAGWLIDALRNALARLRLRGVDAIEAA